MLVDSSMSFIESQGFFKYKISLRDSISNYDHHQPQHIFIFILTDLII